MVKLLLDVLYVLIGLLMTFAGLETWKDHKNPARAGTAAFWLILALIFAFGAYIPPAIVGFLLLVIGALALSRQIKVGNLPVIDSKHAENMAQKLGFWIFAPSLVLAAVSIAVAQFTPLGGQIGIGIGAVASLLLAMVISKTGLKQTYIQSHRLVRAVGTAGILPQLLATLGAVFTAAGVGELTANIVSRLVPIGNPLVGVVLYCFAMALFTMVMGNAFAAFAVITAAIGIPFVVAQGGNPVIVASLGMTAGYCGTLLTPMAANFNTLPVALMEMKDQLGVIRQQLPMALILLVVHMALMYFLAF